MMQGYSTVPSRNSSVNSSPPKRKGLINSNLKPAPKKGKAKKGK